jgi:hypothetical protein
MCDSSGGGLDPEREQERPTMRRVRFVAQNATRPFRSGWRYLIGETQGLVRDATFAGLGQGATILGVLGQITIISHVLGLEAFGTFALTVAFVHLVSRFFDLNAEYMLIAFGAAKIRRSEKAASGVIQFSAIADAVSGLVGFAAVAMLASFAGEHLAGSQGPELFLLFGLTLLVSTVDGTSASTLQLFGRFGLIAGYQVFGEVSRLIAIGVGLLISESLVAVVVALVVHDAVMAVVGAAAALAVFKRTTGQSLLRPALSTVRADFRAMLKMLVHTNVVAYARLAETHIPTLLVGSFHGALEAGVFRVGMAPAAALGKVRASASSAATPRFARLLNSDNPDPHRRLGGDPDRASGADPSGHRRRGGDGRIRGSRLRRARSGGQREPVLEQQPLVRSSGRKDRVEALRRQCRRRDPGSRLLRRQMGCHRSGGRPAHLRHPDQRHAHTCCLAPDVSGASWIKRRSRRAPLRRSRPTGRSRVTRTPRSATRQDISPTRRGKSPESDRSWIATWTIALIHDLCEFA